MFALMLYFIAMFIFKAKLLRWDARILLLLHIQTIHKRDCKMVITSRSIKTSCPVHLGSIITAFVFFRVGPKSYELKFYDLSLILYELRFKWIDLSLFTFF